ncbi:MAG: gamma-glutamyl-phosphate reductase, partial [Dolichospermum sp.]
MTNFNIASSLSAIAQQTRQAASKLAILSSEGKNQAIEAIAQGLESAKDDILQANLADCQAAIATGIAKPLYKRLQLDEHKLRDAIAG